ncbi:MAG: 3-hexulose-6-phosphate synthase [Candidatus Anammoxibacter sp.]
MYPLLQLALDFVDFTRALKVAKMATEGGVDWIEAGTPLLKSEGLRVIRELRKNFPKSTIVADMKTMDAGRIEMETAAKAGANVATVMGVASDATIKECIIAGHNYGIKIGVDLLGVENLVKRAEDVGKWGADFVGLHTAIDDQMKGKCSLGKLNDLCSKVKLPVAVAGGINSETVVDAINAGAEIVVVGGAICKAKDVKKATEEIKLAMKNCTKVPTTFFKRTTSSNIAEILSKVSTANISDGNHRKSGIAGLIPICKSVKIVGKAVTVRTCPGDWAKPVEAIDEANEGDVIVIDAGGDGPAVWGELATISARKKGLAGTVVNGAVRDVGEIRKLKYPVFTRKIVPHAGEPKGLGELNVPINISGITINPGDWIVGDDDGLMVIGKHEVEEVANHAMDWLEKENRLREEIIDGNTTLGKVMELLKWERKY